MEIKHSDKFVLLKRGNTKYIFLQLCFANERHTFTTGFTVDEHYWDRQTQRVKDGYVSPKGKKAKEINKTLSAYKDIINEIFTKYEIVRKYVPTMQQVKDDFQKATKRTAKHKPAEELRPDQRTVEQAIKDFIESEKNIRAWTPAIVRHFNNLKRTFQLWNNDVTLSYLTETTLSNFCLWLTNSKGGNLKNSTAKKRIVQTKTFLRWCNRSGYWKNNLYDTFQPKFKTIAGEKEIIFLTKDELKRWINYKFKDNEQNLERIRDVFTFCCFTGLRHSDVKKLKHKDIDGDIIHVVTQKTSDMININLNNYAKQILDKYKEYDKVFALPVVENQPMNDYLKVIAKKIGIDSPVHFAYYQGNKKYEEVKPKYEVISSHAARRTFVVTAMTLGMDTNVIMKFTGHSSLSAMKPYMSVVDELKQTEMNKFNALDL